MKKNLLIALIAAAGLAPFAAQAQSYVGVGIGSSEQKLSADGAGSGSDRSNGFHLSAGHAFTQNFGIELGFVKQAKIDVDVGDGDVFTSNPKTFYLAGTGSYPLSPQFSLLGKVGVAFNRTDFSDGTSTVMHRETAPLLGVGVAYAFNPAVSAVLQYENYGKLFKESGVKLEGSMVSIGVRFHY
jgi:OOP family OmpA-OmpF porin